jgi:hypothetical protein
MQVDAFLTGWRSELIGCIRKSEAAPALPLGGSR